MKNITNDKACDTVLNLLDSNSNTNNSYSSKQSESLNSFATDITVGFVAPFLGLKLFRDYAVTLLEKSLNFVVIIDDGFISP